MSDDRFTRIVIASIIGVLLLVTVLVKAVQAHDKGQFRGTSPEIKEWYMTLMQPDAPRVSCCGESDAYYCDNWYIRAGKTYCKITDTREDGPLGRPHIPVGTEIWIPDHKLKWDRQNPTGHSVVFVNTMLHVFCFVQGTGI